MCHLCTASKAHRNHDYEPLADAFPRHRQQIVDSLQEVKEKLTVISTAMLPLESQEREFLEQVKTAKEEIKTTVQQLIQLLHESERQLIKELDEISDSYIKKVSAHKKEAEITITATFALQGTRWRATLVRCCGDEWNRVTDCPTLCVRHDGLLACMITVCNNNYSLSSLCQLQRLSGLSSIQCFTLFSGYLGSPGVSPGFWGSILGPQLSLRTPSTLKYPLIG